MTRDYPCPECDEDVAVTGSPKSVVCPECGAGLSVDYDAEWDERWRDLTRLRSTSTIPGGWTVVNSGQTTIVMALLEAYAIYGPERGYAVWKRRANAEAWARKLNQLREVADEGDTAVDPALGA